MGVLLPKQALEYSDIIDYEIHQNGSSVSRGSINLARGIGMGLATSGLGLIVGLVTGGKQKTKNRWQAIRTRFPRYSRHCSYS